jgi:hypothetical protein
MNLLLFKTKKFEDVTHIKLYILKYYLNEFCDLNGRTAKTSRCSVMLISPKK